MPDYKTLRLADVEVDFSIQPRVNGLNQDHVDELEAAYRDENAAIEPPVAWLLPDGSYKLSQGFHRYEGAKRAGRESLKFVVRTGTADECAIDAACSNQAHGLKRTNADKRRAVERLLKLMAKESDRTIADRCGVSDKTVGEARRDMEGRAEIPHVETRTDSKGREQPASKPKEKTKQPENKPSATRQESSGDASKRQETPEADKPKPEDDADQLDTLTELIDKARDIIVANPELAAPAADTLKMLATEARELAPPPTIDERIVTLCRQLDSIAADMDGWKEDPLSYTISFITVQGGIKNVRTALWASRPCCECPYCKGTGKHPRHGEQCKGCKGNKLVTKTTEKSGKAAMGAA